MFKKPLLVFIFIGINAAIFSQKLTPSVVASGGNFTANNSYSLSYTIGEANVTTLKAPTNILTQGFQQQLIKGTIPTIPSPLTALPNPVTSRNHYLLTLTFYVNEETNAYYVTISNLNGKIVSFATYENLLVNDFRIIDFGNFALGMYLVKVQSKNGKILRTFKIEKL